MSQAISGGQTSIFDPGSGTANYSGWDSTYLSKFDPGGEFQWVRVWGDDTDGNPVLGFSVATAGNEGIYVVGRFSGTVDFNPGPETDEHSSNGSTDSFLTKFDSEGTHIWTKTWGGTAGDVSYDVVADENWNAYVTGSGESGDAFLSKFDSTGLFIWTLAWGSIGPDQGSSVSVDGLGNIYVVGYCQGTVDLDPGAGTDIHETNGGRDAFLSKFNPNCVYLWGHTWGDSDFDEATGIALNSLGQSFISGYFAGIVDFDPGPGLDEHTSSGARDAFLCKFPPNGNW